jgi:hypothetical protein
VVVVSCGKNHRHDLTYVFVLDVRDRIGTSAAHI